MKKVLFLVLSIIWFACANNEEGKLPPPPAVIMVPHAADTSDIENGTDAIPDEKAIQVQWYDMDDPNIRYYNIYRKGESETFFSRIGRINLDNAIPPFDTTYIDNDIKLQVYVYYEYYVTATNKDEIEGPVPDSVEAKYMLTEKAITSLPVGSISGIPEFHWSFPQDIPDRYILRIEEEFTKKLHFVRTFPSEYIRDKILDLANVPNVPPFSSNVSYQWRIDCIGDSDPETSGSESEWKTFFIQ